MIQWDRRACTGNQIRIACIGIENEIEAENDMPLRVIGYDGAAYRDQVSYKRDRDGKRRKAADRYPVVTLVLHFDYRKRWDKARTLHEALGESVDSSLKPFVNDYKINLFEIAWLTDEQAALFQSDFRIVADYFMQMRRTGTYSGSKEEARHMWEVLQLLIVLTGDSRFLETMDAAGEGGEVRNMCEVLERIEEKGMIKGREQGIESVNMLNARLIQDGRIADLERSVTDSAYQKQLLYELFPEFRKQK